jgi:hypothetical protein
MLRQLSYFFTLVILENRCTTKVLRSSTESTFIEHFSFYLEFILHLPTKGFDIAYTQAYEQ